MVSIGSPADAHFSFSTDSLSYIFLTILSLSLMSDFFPEKESGQAVMLVFETVIDKSQLLDFKHFTSLAIEYSIQDSDFMEKHY